MWWWYCLVSGLILLVKILESLGLVVSDVKETKHEHNPGTEQGWLENLWLGQRNIGEDYSESIDINVDDIIRAKSSPTWQPPIAD